MENVVHEGVRGDEIVTVEVVVPQLRDERSKEILREFDRGPLPSAFVLALVIA